MSFFQLPAVNDLLPWKWFDRLPKSGNGSDILIFGSNPFFQKTYSVWHVKPKNVFPHTRKFRILRAICENDINEVKAVLDQEFDPNTIIDDKYKYTPLHLASALNRSTIIDYLLLRGADIDFANPSGNTPLMIASMNWNFDAIKLLVERGADTTKKDMYGFDVIDKAKMRQLNSIASFFLSKKTDSSTPKGGQGTSLAEKKGPLFDICFDFEKQFGDATEGIYKEKKIHSSKAKVYPWNNFKGMYIITLFYPKYV